jgi:hypothetical protein
VGTKEKITETVLRKHKKGDRKEKLRVTFASPRQDEDEPISTGADGSRHVTAALKFIIVSAV